MMNQEFYMYVKNKKMISQKWYYMKVFPKMGKGRQHIVRKVESTVVRVVAIDFASVPRQIPVPAPGRISAE